MYHGIINVYKEKGFTSHDVVAKMRGMCGQKKVGHTGTLDPDAEGVLPICLGKATKVCAMLTDSDKEYRTVMLLGVETDTQDMTGEVLRRTDISGLTEADVRGAAASFVGTISQIPPMYSALKVNGKKLCDLARAGVTVDRKARQVVIRRIPIDKIDLPRVSMTVECSKGTYIRTLCHDIGQKLGCGAAMESLVRTRAAGYRAADALRLSQLQSLKDEGRLEEAIHPVEEVFAGYPALIVRPEAEKLLKNGGALRADHFERLPASALSSPVRLYDGAGKFTAVYRYEKEESFFRPIKMFSED